MSDVMKLLGYVTTDLHRYASYVRVNVPQYDGVPLSLKVDRGNFQDHSFFVKGRAVEVTLPVGHTGYISNVFFENDLGMDEKVCGGYEPEPQLIDFFIGERYFRDVGHAHSMGNILMKVFSIKAAEYKTLVKRNGFWIRCREDQLARFMISRNAHGLPNGFMDLKVKYVNDKPKKIVDVSSN